jgi:hypothetical protein
LIGRPARRGRAEPAYENSALLYRPGPNKIQTSEQLKAAGLGSEHGELTNMAGTENWKERRDQIARYRVLEQETTDPLAARLLHDIVLELEADLKEPAESVDLNA